MSADHAVRASEPIAAAWHEAKYCAPALGGMCLAVLAALLPGQLLSPGVTPIAIGLSALLSAPAWAGSLAVADAILAGRRPGIRDLPRHIRTQAIASIRTATPLAFSAVCFLVALGGYEATRQWIFLPPAAIGGAATAFTLLASPHAFMLRRLTNLRGRHLWFSAIGLAIAKPTLSLGLIALAVLFFYAGLTWSFSVLMLLPGPLAVLSVLSVRAACRAKDVALADYS